MAQATTDNTINEFEMTPQRWYDLLVEAGVTRKDMEPSQQDRIIIAYLSGPTVIPPQTRADFLIILPPGFDLPTAEWLEIEKLFGIEREDKADDKEKLQTHVLNFPNDLVSRLLLNCCERIEGLEGKSARYDSVVHMHTPLG